MRIVTWNVNGIRAALRKGVLDWIEAESPEVLCLQEVRARPEQIEKAHLEGLGKIYPHKVWNPAERAGYSGVATLASREPLETRLGLDAPEFDREGRVVVSRYPDSAWNEFNRTGDVGALGGRSNPFIVRVTGATPETHVDIYDQHYYKRKLEKERYFLSSGSPF